MNEEFGEKMEVVVFNSLCEDYPGCPRCGALPSGYSTKHHESFSDGGDMHCRKCGFSTMDCDVG